nr:O-antigen translocase [Stutzerimonas stutzeri]
MIKTSLLNGIAVVIKMLTLLGLNKILAIYVGPAGYAALGQFQSTIQMITTLASGAITTGVVKYTAEYHEDVEKQHAIWRTASSISLVGTLIIATIVVVFRDWLAEWFLKNKDYADVFVWFSATLVLFVFNTLLLAILNGKKEIKRYVIANIAGSLFAFIVTTVMVIYLKLYGALVALAIYQSLTFFVTAFLASKTKWFRVKYLFGAVDFSALKGLAKYTIMALTTALCVPLSHILIRNHIGETIGWNEAGYWEAMWRLSSAYLMVVTTTLSVYYLPKLSELKEPGAIKKEILQGYKIILPVAALCGILIYLMRDLIIRLLFSEQFSEMNVLFGWQMVGDTLKIGSWLLGCVLIAKAFFKIYIASEILFSLFFYAAIYFLSDIYGIESTVISYAISYAFHFLGMFLSLRHMKVI